MATQNFIEELKRFDWSDLNDIDTVGNWPAAVKGLICIVFVVAVLVAGYFLLIKELQNNLDTEINKEPGLKLIFEAKAYQAAHLDAYREQLEEMDRVLGDKLKQLPSATEMQDLIADIYQGAKDSGLEVLKFEPGSKTPKEYYLEQPIAILVRGSFHELGAFVSGMASNQGRIVTLHDFTIDKDTETELLLMKVTAKTYSYNQEGDQEDDEV